MKPRTPEPRKSEVHAPDAGLNTTREPLKRLEDGLPSHWYRDVAHYQRELDAIWHRHWIAVAREEELIAPGDYRVVNAGTQSVLLVRNTDGSLRAFHNTCRHRGSILATGYEGRFAHGRVTCPYHAWTYDLEGRLHATPKRMPTPDFDATQFSLYPMAVGAWGGFVFVNLADAPEADLHTALGGLPERFQRHGLAKLRIGKRIVTDVQANWKLIAENFSECFHCPPVHPELCRIVPAYRDAGVWGLGDLPESGPEYRPDAATLTLDGSARIPPFRGLDDSGRRTLYMPWMLPPNLFLNVHPDYVNAHMMFPTGPESVRIVYDWLFEPDHMPKGKDLDHYVALWDITNRQDARNCEWQQRGLQSMRFDHGVFVPQEFDCHRFCNWVREQLCDKIPSKKE